MPKKKSNSSSEPRGAKEPLPGVSPAWEKMKSKPKGERVVPYSQRVRHTHAGPGHPSWGRPDVIPGRCTCSDVVFEASKVQAVIPLADGKIQTVPAEPNPAGETRNPWIHGHMSWCSMWMAKCDDCGQTGGTHHRDCQFWKLHPDLTPF